MVVVVVVVVFDNFTERQVGDCEENLKMKYIWLLLSLWIIVENFMEGQQQVGDY